MKTMKVLSINNDTFWELKNDFDSILMKTLSNMEEKNAPNATISLKLGIALERETIKDVSHPEGKVVVVPSFKHEISSVMQIKSKVSGALDGDNQLVYDSEKDEYVLKPIDDGQMSLFGEQYDEESENSNEETNEAGPSCFERLLPYVGKDLYIEKCDFGYGVCCADEWVIPHYEKEESLLFIPQEVLQIHEEEGLECTLVESDDGMKCIQIIGIESDVCLLSVAKNKDGAPVGHEVHVDLDRGLVDSYEYGEPNNPSD